ncbi:hypothetical protein F5Y03DRAFT_390975 [Xylaria venustula]|nr:hypothetical protein F5Y03DRAFT_390975 [Xylaria venustula]
MNLLSPSLIPSLSNAAIILLRFCISFNTFWFTTPRPEDSTAAMRAHVKTIAAVPATRAVADDIVFLADHGADIGARDKLGRTAVHYAAALTDEENIEKLLDISGIDVNQRDDDGWTPLIWACQQRTTYNLITWSMFLSSAGLIYEFGEGSKTKNGRL